MKTLRCKLQDLGRTVGSCRSTSTSITLKSAGPTLVAEFLRTRAGSSRAGVGIGGDGEEQDLLRKGGGEGMTQTPPHRSEDPPVTLYPLISLVKVTGFPPCSSLSRRAQRTPSH
ncbi:hypothetical protein SKAU_G00228690 [Synaphobranchus kaupii]|uniref:Uncharacterized protein n=1 Tax=Synaphobranchus kaupii TaxID=118154 RepID=A0A9Q1F576_SYNKA|nr:hypothetical protein SKAU_G00228690 [Synaphobranchus kaupii]